MLLNLLYAQELINNEWVFQSFNLELANSCLRQLQFNNEPIHIPVIMMQRGGPTDSENQEFLQQVSSKFVLNDVPYFFFDLLRKVEIGSGLDASTVGDSDSIDPEGLKIRDQLVNDKLTLNVLQSEKIDSSGHYAYDNLPYDRDIIQLRQDDNSINAFVHEIGKWLGLKTTFDGGCSTDLVDDTLPEHCDTDNFMQFPGITRSRFTQGQVFRMLNTYYWRKNGDVLYSGEFNNCVHPFVPPAIDPATVPVFPEWFEREFFYDHYDYAKGIDDLTNTIRSKTGNYDIIIEVDWFYAEEMNQGLLEANLQRLNDLHRANLSPIQFRLRTIQAIQEDEILFDELDQVTLKYSLNDPKALTLITGNYEEYAVAVRADAAVVIDTDKGDNSGWYQTLAHEFGHFIGLHHTFEYGCDPGDYVSDTKPIMKEADGSFADSSCGYAGNYRNNIMDYYTTVDIIHEVLYTPGQYYRMMVNVYWRLVGEMPQYVDGIVMARETRNIFKNGKQKLAGLRK